MIRKIGLFLLSLIWLTGICAAKGVTVDGVELRRIGGWPAKSEEVLDAAGWHLSQIAGQSIAGMPSLRLENGNTLRLQCQGTDALYTVETDLLSGEELAALLQPLQLVEN